MKKKPKRELKSTRQSLVPGVPKRIGLGSIGIRKASDATPTLADISEGGGRGEAGGLVPPPIPGGDAEPAGIPQRRLSNVAQKKGIFSSISALKQEMGTFKKK